MVRRILISLLLLMWASSTEVKGSAIGFREARFPPGLFQASGNTFRRYSRSSSPAPPVEAYCSNRLLKQLVSLCGANARPKNLRSINRDGLMEYPDWTKRSNSEVADNLFQRKMPRNIVEECCLQPCTVRQLMRYCEHFQGEPVEPGKLVAEPTSTTTTPPPTPPPQSTLLGAFMTALNYWLTRSPDQPTPEKIVQPNPNYGHTPPHRYPLSKGHPIPSSGFVPPSMTSSGGRFSSKNAHLSGSYAPPPYPALTNTNNANNADGNEGTQVEENTYPRSYPTGYQQSSPDWADLTKPRPPLIVGDDDSLFPDDAAVGFSNGFNDGINFSH